MQANTVIAKRELHTITSIIINSINTQNPVSSTCNIFLRSVLKLEHTKWAQILLFVIENSMLPPNEPVIIAISILFVMLKNDNDAVQFSIFFDKLKYAFALNTLEGQFVNLLISQPEPEKILLNDANRIVKFLQKSKTHETASNRKVDLSNGLSCVIPDPDILSSDCSTNNPQNCSFDSTIPISVNGILKPRFLRLQPPILPIYIPKKGSKNEEFNDILSADDSSTAKYESLLEEMIWLNPMTIDHEFYFDESMGSNENSETDSLLRLAYEVALNLGQQKSLSRSINEDPNMILAADLDPREFHKLVTFNSIIAMEVINCFKDTPKMNEYLDSLLEIEISVNSMEVVNKIATATELPLNFISIYVTKCIQACDSIEHKHPKNRLVRMVCVLFQALIRHNQALKNDENLLTVIQSFSTDHVEMSQSSNLFRLLKTIETSKKPAV